MYTVSWHYLPAPYWHTHSYCTKPQKDRSPALWTLLSTHTHTQTWSSAFSTYLLHNLPTPSTHTHRPTPFSPQVSAAKASPKTSRVGFFHKHTRVLRYSSSKEKRGSFLALRSYFRVGSGAVPPVMSVNTEHKVCLHTGGELELWPAPGQCTHFPSPRLLLYHRGLLLLFLKLCVYNQMWYMSSHWCK